MSVKNNIKNAILNFGNDNFFENSIELFKTLGYKSTRRIDLPTKEDFKNFVLQREFNEDKVLYTEWENAEFLFELRTNELNTDEKNITTDMVDNTAIEAYWFVAIELNGINYTKKQLSDITREINKQRPMPVFILFKYADKLTFSIIDRRLNKTDETKDVLEKIVLIKDININHTHRAHIDILSSIAFENLNVDSFAELHKIWLKALSVSELNKKFYTELSNWFFWTMDTCQLSKDNTVKDNVMFGIRMVTRIIFDWFIKEKGLVSEKIFDKQTYLDLLKPEYKEQGDLYYKVVLQNLFFGCLSKPMDRREFRSEDRFHGKNTGYDVNNLFRYAKYLNNPQEVVEMFKDIPFLNGGLFECTDDKRNGKYIDCFTDNDSRNFLKISDDIFFMEDEKIVDLSSHFDGNKSYKNAKVRGLFPILNSYKFTIDETTPVEEEIALDPELLGRVFENLLAAHNPETKTTARKSTGSYYTPREIVDYMCEQSLINYLKTKIEHLNIDDLDDKLEELLSYSETHSFSDAEVDELIKAVNEVKILDPACGSGAFPMGLLHKLVHVLSKLDPHNLKWKESQIEKANLIDDLEAREEAINIIERQFEDNEMDYSRKLYLIQNCIFGVDIQPMATQISRLRFFISLIVDEKPNKSKPNMGILALPNLETKFVAANTLIDLPQNNLFSTFPSIVKLREELEKVRAMHFRANSSRKKTEIQNKDNEIRMRIKQESITLGATFESAAKLADWSPYDKDYSSDWFNPKWMFNVDKFDIVIGNPPYIGEKGNKEIFQAVKQSTLKKFYQGKMDYFYFFFHLALNILKDKGQCALITTNYYITADGAKNLRTDLKERSILLNLINFNEFKVFESALGQHNIITILQKGINNKYPCNIININKKGFLDCSFDNVLNGLDKDCICRKINQEDLYEGKDNYIRLLKEESNSILSIILNKIFQNNDLLGNISDINSGADVTISRITNKHLTQFNGNYTYNDGVFVLSNEELNALNLNDDETNIIKDYIKNSNIFKYGTSLSDDKLIYLKWEDNIELYPHIKSHLSRFKDILQDQVIRYDENYPWWALHRPRVQTIFDSDEKIIVPYRTKSNIFGYYNKPLYSSRDVFFITNIKREYNFKYVLSLLNSNLYYIWLYNKGKRKGDTLELYYTPLSEIPIKQVSTDIQDKFISIVDKILILTQSKDYLLHEEKHQAVKQYEKQINVMVYKLYELTFDEVKTIDNDFTMTEAEYNNYNL
ncbi:DUF4391 domain-containing protein [bacterium]|nr:DUF4391 domain-containing protein [bacterium]